MRSGVPTGCWPAGWPSWMLTPTRRPSSWWPSCCVGPAPDPGLGWPDRDAPGPVGSLANAHDHAVARWDRGSDPTSPGGVAVREARSALDAACEPAPAHRASDNTELSIASGGAGQAQQNGGFPQRTRKGSCQSIRADDLRVEQNGRGSQTGIAGNMPRRVAANQNPSGAAACLTLPPNSARSLARLVGHRRDADGCAVCAAVRIPGDRPGGFLGQAVAGGLPFWRGRRLRGAAAAAVVAPGLRPRFFSVLPTPANFRSR